MGKKPQYRDPTTGLSMNLLATAAHELGHAVTAHHLGIEVDRIQVWHTGGDAFSGTVDSPDKDEIGTDEIDGYLITFVAGHEAHARWLHEHHPAFGDHSLDDVRQAAERAAGIDLDNARRYRRRGGSLSDSAARAHARRILTQRWHMVLRGAVLLARKRHLSSLAGL